MQKVEERGGGEDGVDECSRPKRTIAEAYDGVACLPLDVPDKYGSSDLGRRVGDAIRSVNNTVKAVAIRYCCEVASDPAFRAAFAPVPVGQWPPRRAVILDVACGRGGDVRKWSYGLRAVAAARAWSTWSYVGVDISPGSVVALKARYAGDHQSGPGKIHAFVRDARGAGAGVDAAEMVRADDQSCVDTAFVNIQFALHYLADDSPDNTLVARGVRFRGLVESVAGFARSTGARLVVLCVSRLMPESFEDAVRGAWQHHVGGPGWDVDIDPCGRTFRVRVNDRVPTDIPERWMGFDDVYNALLEELRRAHGGYVVPLVRAPFGDVPASIGGGWDAFERLMDKISSSHRPSAAHRAGAVRLAWDLCRRYEMIIAAWVPPSRHP